MKFYLCDLHACGHIRGEIVAREINSRNPEVRVDCKTAIMLSDFPRTDVMVFQRQHSPGVLEKMRLAKQQKIATVFDIDDDLFSVPAALGDAHTFYARPEIQNALNAFLCECDLITVSTVALATALRHRTSRPMYVVENGLDTERWVRKREPSEYLTIGWMASGTHRMDVPLIEAALERIMLEYEHVRLVFVGWVGFNELPRLAKFKHRITTMGWQDINILPDIMSNFDIGLAPLVEHPFNSCKSGIKALQYWAASTSVVCSPSPPYECVTDGKDGLYASESAAWYEALRRLVEDPALRMSLGSNGRQKLMDRYDISRTAENWRKVFEIACSGRENVR